MNSVSGLWSLEHAQGDPAVLHYCIIALIAAIADRWPHLLLLVMAISAIVGEKTTANAFISAGDNNCKHSLEVLALEGE
jgi:hypothetical protein